MALVATARETNQKGISLRLAKCCVWVAGAADCPLIHTLNVSALAKMVLTSWPAAQAYSTAAFKATWRMMEAERSSPDVFDALAKLPPKLPPPPPKGRWILIVPFSFLEYSTSSPTAYEGVCDLANAVPKSPLSKRTSSLNRSCHCPCGVIEMILAIVIGFK